MMYRWVIFLACMVISLQLFAQKKLKGRYDPDSQQFICAYTGILVSYFISGRAPFMIKGKDPSNYKTNRTGFIDTAGNIVVKPVYIECTHFNGDFACVQDTAAQWGVINRSGKVIIPFMGSILHYAKTGFL